jgi:hypothetical protein
MSENEIAKIIVDTCYHIHVELRPGLFESVYEEVLWYVNCSRSRKVSSCKLQASSWEC